MKVPKGNEMKRYVILVCIVLVFIVLSTALAGYVSTNNIPEKVNQNIESLPQWGHLESLQSNLSKMETVLQLGDIFQYTLMLTVRLHKQFIVYMDDIYMFVFKFEFFF